MQSFGYSLIQGVHDPMSETITLELPSHVVRKARSAAAASNRKLEDAVVDWIERAVQTTSIESLTNEELIAECDRTFLSHDQDEFSQLLSLNRESQLNSVEQERLNHLQTQYREGTIRKARAWKEAISRGIRPRLTDHVS